MIRRQGQSHSYLRSGLLKQQSTPMRKPRSTRRKEEQPFEYSVRAATLKDYAGIVAVFQEADAMHVDALSDIFRHSEAPVRTREYVASVIAGEDSTIFVAEQKKQIVGAVQVQIHEAPSIPMMRPRRYAVIENIVVKKDLRCLGMGRSLMEQAQAWARDKQVGSVELSVWEFNKAALAFFQRLGYRTASRKMRKQLS